MKEYPTRMSALRVASAISAAIVIAVTAGGAEESDSALLDSVKSKLQCAQATSMEDYRRLSREIVFRAADSDAALKALFALLEVEPFPGQQHIPPILAMEDKAAARPALMRAIGSRSWRVRWTTTQALVAMNDPTLLAEALTFPTSLPASLLAKECKEAPEPLLVALSDPNPLVRGNALYAAGAMGRRIPALAEPLLRVLQESHSGLRILAAEALLQHAPNEAAPPLETAVSDALDGSALHTHLADLYLTVAMKASPSERTPLPHYQFIREQIESEHAGEPLFTCSLLLEGQEDPLYLAKRRGTGMEKRGIIEDSLRPVWIKPGELLQISWQTHGRNSIGTCILLAKEADDWRLLYRDSIRTSNGNIGMGFGIYTKFGFSYCATSDTLTLCHTTDEWHTSTKPRPLYQATGDTRFVYSTKYTHTSRWPCRITNGHVEIEPGTRFITFEDSEFPIEELAEYLARWASWKDLEQNERIQKLRRLNPQLEGRTHCAGRLLMGVDTPPHKPDEAEYEYVSVCEK